MGLLSILATGSAHPGLKVLEIQSYPTSPGYMCPRPHSLGQQPQMERLPSRASEPAQPTLGASVHVSLFSAARPACPAGFDQVLTKPHFSVSNCSCLCFLANKCHVFPTGLLSSEFILTLCEHEQISTLCSSPIFCTQ